MGRRYYSQKSNHAAIEHVRQYNALERRLGPIIGDIKDAFLSLTKDDFDSLLIPYEKEYGKNAKEYALMAFPRWKTGRTKMSGQTAERLLNLVPKYLTTNQRYVIVKKLCDYHIKKTNKYLNIDIENPYDGLNEVEKLISEFQNFSFLKYLPEHVLETATWLNDDDVIVARALLSEIDKRICEEITQFAKIELNNLQSAIRSQRIETGSQHIDFPNGSLTINFYKKDRCFVASTAFRSNQEYPVLFLRHFRDTYLNQKKLGKQFIDWYYRNGSEIANVIEDKETLCLLTRLLLIGLVNVISVFYPLQLEKSSDNEQ